MAGSHGSCSGPAWKVDDLTPCYKHWYIQSLPVATTTLVSALIVVYSVAPKLWKAIFSYLESSDPAYKPLLSGRNTDDDDANPNDVDEDVDDSEFVTRNVNYGSLFSGADSDSASEVSSAASASDTTVGDKSSVVIATVVRSTADRVRVALEAVAVTAQVALAIGAALRPEISAEWSSDNSHVPAVQIAFWLYALTLVVVRLLAQRAGKVPPGGLWYHSTTIYPIAWVLGLISLRSTVLHPFSTASRGYYIASFALSTLLFYLNWSSRFGDRPAQLYVTPNITPSNEQVSSLFQLITFSYLDPLIWKGYWKSLSLADVWELRGDDHAASILHNFRKVPNSLSFTWRMVRYFKRELLLAGMYAVLYAGSTFGPALLVKAILDYVDDPSRAPQGVAWLYVIAIFVIAAADNILHGQALFIGRRICIRMRAIIIGEVYAKALRRKISVEGGDTALGQKNDKAKNGAKNGANTDGDEDSDKDGEPKVEETQANLGAIINLMAIDAFKVSELCGYLHYFVAGSLQIVASVALLYKILGWSAFVGAGTIFGVMPLNYWFSTKFAQYQNEMMKITDKRVEKTNEVLQSIRVIKYFAWEDQFAKGVYDVREQELKVLWKRCLIWTFGTAIWCIVPVLISVLSFASYTLLQGQVLTAPVAFTAIALFNIMRVPMDQLADMLSNVLQAKVSVDRVEDFLNEAETNKYKYLVSNQPRGPNSPHVGFENANFTWGTPNREANPDAVEFKLRDINLAFPVGELSIVVGPTGSGKTSLLMALLGEMDLLSGRVFLPGGLARDEVKPDPQSGLADTVAYCAQQAWLLNDTVKNNILFASPYNEERYTEVIEACALKRDLEILEAGDETEIGEKGITLSGGQKQRISLARAMYSNARHLLLDDCLSAVDSHTGAYIYEHCLTGPIAENRTIILVSHNVALTISKAHKVIVMENGRITANGPPQTVVEAGALGDDDLIRQSASQSASEAATRVSSSTNLAEATKGKTGSLATELKKKLKKQAQKGEAAAAVAAAAAKEPEAEASAAPPQKLVQEEAMSEGYVDRKVYISYLLAMGGFWYWAFLVFFFMCYQFAGVINSWWIREWTVKGMIPGNGTTSATTSTAFHDYVPIGLFAASYKGLVQSWQPAPSNPQAQLAADIEFAQKKPRFEHSTEYYLAVYFLIGVFGMVTATIREAFSFWGGLRAARKMFEGLMNTVLATRMRFFDSTPIGRVMNRFSKDIEGVDQDAAPVFAGMTHCIMVCVTTALLIVVITPGFSIAVLVIFTLYSSIAAFYLATSRELKRIDSVSKSPIYQHFGETLVGVATIRAYGDQRRFVRDNLSKIDTNNRPFFYLWVANRWLSFRVDTTGALVSFCAAAFILLQIGSIDAGLAGLSLSYALGFNETALWVVRLYAIMEMNMNSVERVQEYMSLESEGERIIEGHRPPADWPTKGEIKFDNLSLRYAAELPLVIKNASFEVESFQKIGIVGRTGAGKSTIITALFRFLEADSGRIEIDGIDIASIGLYDLRRALAIIPQDPTLFVGTIRSNLDPFEEYTDGQIFESLRRVHLISAIPEAGSSVSRPSSHSGSPLGGAQPVVTDVEGATENANQFLNLNSPVKEGGSNMSQGQRQLMCLARSLLKLPKVLLLDEATASIDYETDSRIQQTIREEFSNSTLLTIAHRLKSIIDYDKILVMDAGEVREYDEPHVLLQRDSLFRDMCVKSGELESLEALAEQAYNKKHTPSTSA